MADVPASPATQTAVHKDLQQQSAQSPTSTSALGALEQGATLQKTIVVSKETHMNVPQDATPYELSRESLKSALFLLKNSAELLERLHLALKTSSVPEGASIPLGVEIQTIQHDVGESVRLARRAGDDLVAAQRYTPAVRYVVDGEITTPEEMVTTINLSNMRESITVADLVEINLLLVKKMIEGASGAMAWINNVISDVAREETTVSRSSKTTITTPDGVTATLSSDNDSKTFETPSLAQSGDASGSSLLAQSNNIPLENVDKIVKETRTWVIPRTDEMGAEKQTTVTETTTTVYPRQTPAAF